ncbi:uncharacterized protein [Drosophila tropicalis]|uniref:uncharacterized protein n=1 Tax=Drosophila tropicalis TaxID=46794 RepID=UPI0035ABCAF0
MQMEKFSHDLTLALEETSLMCGVGRGRWISRRRTRSTGNLPCAPQPTEDSSSSPSPTDTLNAHGDGAAGVAAAAAGGGTNIDGLDPHNLKMPASDSDDKAEGNVMPLPPRLPLPGKQSIQQCLGALESDSLNETNFSPTRFFKPNSRRKRKIKRMSMEFELAASPHSFTESPLQPGMLGNPATGLVTGSSTTTTTGTIRKRLMKTEAGSHRSNLFFCGKRKRSNRDRYHDHEPGFGTAVGLGLGFGKQHLHSASMPRYTHTEECQRMRPRSYSSTSKPHSDRLMPLNKGLLSKINRMAQAQEQQQQTEKTDNEAMIITAGDNGQNDQIMTKTMPAKENITTRPSPPPPPPPEGRQADAAFGMETVKPVTDIDALLMSTPSKTAATNQGRIKKMGQSSSASKVLSRRRFCHTPQPHSQSMDCSELYDFLSSSSLSSSSDSDEGGGVSGGGVGGHRRHDTDREGDDELTDWPGNEFGHSGKYDPKRKLTKKSLLPQIRSDDTIGEDDTLMSGTEGAEAVSPVAPQQLPDALKNLSGFQMKPAPPSSDPIEIQGASNRNSLLTGSDANLYTDMDTHTDGVPAAKQIESEMSGETSNPFLSSSPPVQVQEVREIRAGCRRINGDRPGFSIKLSVNERLARFLQDPRQTQIRLPDLEISEHDSLYNLATLYSLDMIVEHGCTVLTKTRNTTQPVNMEHYQPTQGIQQHQDLFSDFKRRCYGDDGDAVADPDPHGIADINVTKGIQPNK